MFIMMFKVQGISCAVNTARMNTVLLERWARGPFGVAIGSLHQVYRSAVGGAQYVRAVAGCSRPRQHRVALERRTYIASPPSPRVVRTVVYLGVLP